MITTEIKFDYAAVPAGEAFSLRLMLGLIGEKTNTPPLPLNLGLVLDRSGSMSGSKIQQAIEATRMIAGMLHPDEYLTLSAFDSKAELLMPATRAVEKPVLEQILSKVRAGSNTNMGLGYKLAHDQVKSVMGSNVSRLVVLSDGQVNEGMRSEELCDLVESCQLEGITTSTFGVGDDFDENLMTEMAQRGGGTAYYIDTPSDSVAVFREELDALRNLAAPQCRVTFTKKLSGMVCTQLNSYQVTGTNSWLLGDISFAEVRNLVLEFELPESMQIGDVQLGDLQVSWMELNEHGERAEQSVVLPVTIQRVTLEQFNQVVPDDTVTIEAALLTIAKGKRTARDLGSKRKFDEAADLLENLANQIEGLELYNAQLAEEIANIRERAKRLWIEPERFLSAREQKLMMFESDLMGKCKRMSYMSSKERYMREMMAQRGGNDSLMVVHREVSGRGNIGCPLAVTGRTVVQFMHNLADEMGDQSYVESYGKEWLLQEEASGRVFDIGPGWAKAQGTAVDNRDTDLAGLQPGKTLRAIPIAPPVKFSGSIPGNLIIIDLSQLLTGSQAPVQEFWAPDQPTCDFLAKIYYMMSTVVKPNTYGYIWALREADSGRIFDVGSAWARSMGILTDTRPLVAVGIRGGTLLEVISLTSS